MLKTIERKKKEVAGKMSGNTPAQAKRNNNLMMEIDKHNRSWNGREYTYKSKS